MSKLSEEEILDKLRKMLYHTQKANECGLSNNDFKEDIETLEGILDLYQKEKEKNKNKDKILQNIREEFLKYNWKNAKPIQTYNQVKSLYEAIYLKPYEDENY